MKNIQNASTGKQCTRWKFLVIATKFTLVATACHVLYLMLYSDGIKWPLNFSYTGSVHFLSSRAGSAHQGLHFYSYSCNDLIPFSNHFEHQLSASDLSARAVFLEDLTSEEQNHIMDPINVQIMADILQPYVSCVPDIPYNKSFDENRIFLAKNMNNMKHIEQYLQIENECQKHTDVFTGNLNQEPVFIIDSSSFGWEYDVLEFHVNEYYDTVDYILLQESIYGQRIIQKPQFYEAGIHNGRLAELDPLNKIIHIIEDDRPYYKYFEDYLRDKESWKNYIAKHHGKDWRNEGKFRFKGLLDFMQTLYNNDIDQFLKEHPRSLLIVSDLDEIISKYSLRLLKYCQIKDEESFWNQSATDDEARVPQHPFVFRYTMSVGSSGMGASLRLHRITKNLYQTFKQASQQNMNSKHGQSSSMSTWYQKLFPYRQVIGSWHFNRMQTPFQLFLKQMYLAESGNYFAPDFLCHQSLQDDDWKIKNIYTSKSNQNIHNTNAWITKQYLFGKYGISVHDSFSECKLKVVQNPMIIKNVYDLSLMLFFPVKSSLEKALDRRDSGKKNQPLPDFIIANKQRYPQYFPRFCTLVDDINHQFNYQCNWTNFDSYHDNYRL